jgi:hypothetical protein
VWIRLDLRSGEPLESHLLVINAGPEGKTNVGPRLGCVNGDDSQLPPLDIANAEHGLQLTVRAHPCLRIVDRVWFHGHDLIEVNVVRTVSRPRIFHTP